MKRNLMTVVATLVAVFFFVATIAEAADIKFGGQLRPRFEVWEQGPGTAADFDSRTSAEFNINTRIRLNMDVDINDSTSAFLQLQAIGVYGSITNASGSRSATVASDAVSDAGFHQAYFTLKNFFDSPVDLRFGRQEITLDGHRLIGSTGWTPGAQAHDAILLSYAQENVKLVYAFSKVTEDTVGVGVGDPGDDQDINVHILWGNFGHFKDLFGGPLSLYFIALDDNSFNTASSVAGTNPPPPILTFAGDVGVDNNIYTVGLRQAGHLDQLWGIDYRGEFYYQFGDADGISGVTGTDRGAHMFGLRVGKKFNDVSWQPSVTVWYDHLSGTDDSDIASGDFSTFNTLFDTGHKYYGLMDLFLPGTGAGTSSLGLRDLAAKFSVKPQDSLTLKADIHVFWTDVNLDDNPTLRAGFLGFGATSATAGSDNHLGEELDLTAVYKYNPNTTIVVGYSHFWADDLFHAVSPKSASGVGGTGTDDDANWAYVMFNVVF